MDQADQDFEIVMVDGDNGEEEFRGLASEYLIINDGDESVADMVRGLRDDPKTVQVCGFYRFFRPEDSDEAA